LPAADSQLLDIDRVCAMLRDHPFAGRSRDELRPDLRSAVARAYVVFYRVTVRLEIVRVLHGRRDLDAIFAAGSER
jgi:plasmid stabilization system protein ParE